MNKSLMLTALGLLTLIAFGAALGRSTAAPPNAAEAARADVARSVSPSAGSSLASARPVVSTQPVASVISPEAQRLEARRQLYESVDALVQASEFDKARRLLDDDQARYGDDLAPPWHDLEQSYRLIADCLEHPDPRLRVRARAFAEVSEAVSLKPRILQACGAAR